MYNFMIPSTPSGEKKGFILNTTSSGRDMTRIEKYPLIQQRIVTAQIERNAWHTVQWE